MIFYKDILKKCLLFFVIYIGVVIGAHIIVSLILRSFMYYNTVVVTTLVFNSIGVIVTIITMLLLCYKRNKSISKILGEQCDPFKAIDECLIAIDECIGAHVVYKLYNFLGSCYFRAHMHKKAINLYEATNIIRVKCNIDTKILWYHNYIMNLISLGLESKVEEFQFLMNEYASIYPKKLSLVTSLIESHNNYSLLISKRYKDVKKYYEEELQFCNTTCEKVVFNAHLVKIKKTLHEDFEINLNYVIEYGNKLPIKEEIELLVKGENV